MTLPFDGAISSFFENEAPKAVTKAVKGADKDDILALSYPYRERLKRKDYEKQIKALQVELVKMQAWVKSSGARIAVVFEGRDAAARGAPSSAFART